jgi:hypothetical protein
MTKPQSHVTETQDRTFSGDDECRALLDWLNSAGSLQKKARVVEIIEMFHYLRSGWEVKRTSSAEEETVHAQYTRADRQHPIERLKKQLSRYSYHPFFFPMGAITMVHWMPAGRRKYVSHGWAIDYDDANAVFDLARLAELELLDRLKKCRCGRWLFARFAHQRFCSSKCREQEFRSSPEWKEHRRKKARQYYQLHKSGKVK